MKNLNLAVIGKDVSASLSPEIHSFLAKRLGYNVNFKKLSIRESVFDSEIANLIKSLDGFNVTIPYKLSVIPYLDNIKSDASVFGAVNTVKTSTRTGYNTDGLGFSLMLKNSGVDVRGKNVLVLGAGGAGRSVAKTLSNDGAKVFLYNRSYEKAKTVAKEFEGVTALKTLEEEPYFAIINATGVGMHDTVGKSPVDNNLLKVCEIAIDLIYNPEKTEFLRIAEDLGKKTLNGFGMLFYQAYYSACIFAELSSDESQAKFLFEEYIKEKK